jgi:hypothetical protein
VATLTTSRGSYIDIPIVDLSGGLNARDAATELAANETPDCLNVTLDERGGARKRLGLSAWASAVANPVTYGFESTVCNLMLWYSQADGKLYQDTSGALTDSKTFTADHPVQIVDFAGACYITHPVDGLWVTPDGASWTQVFANSGSVPTGCDLAAVWQNKLWLASSASNELFFCAPGDATRWDSADDAGANHLREGNDYPIVCLYGSSGTDIQAQPALLVGKRSGAKGSLHRVTDAATGNYVTLDQSIGPAGPQAVTNLYGLVYLVSTDGIFRTDGQSPLVPVSQKIEPMFRPTALDYTHASLYTAGRQADRLYFSVTRQGSAVNDLCFEYHPLFGAFTVRDDAMACYVSHGTAGDVLLGGSPAAAGQIYQLNATGDDNGTNIESYFYTRVFEPGGSQQMRLQHVRVLGRGPFTITALPNFQTNGVEKNVNIASDGFQWDLDGWDNPDVGWGEPVAEGYADFWPRLVAKAFQLKVAETSSLTSTAPPLPGGGIEETIGAWALYGLHLSFSPLGTG